MAQLAELINCLEQVSFSSSRTGLALELTVASLKVPAYVLEWP